jgi:hypothetical protein
MSLFGLISRAPLRVRTVAANGSGWSFCVIGSERAWEGTEAS